ncbi:MAG TPA: polyphosphate kinase 2 family protein [Haliangiales bacterium]|nr:polyphosphate kinase 2 family protein [Haliangiales bacterium]
MLAHRVKPGSKVKLADIDADDAGPYKGKDDARVEKKLAADLEQLIDLQELLYAEQKQSLLVVLQAMDTAGKDGVLRKVVGPLDSRGVHVSSFKAPSSNELAHDYLWRVHARTPQKGDIVFFNRSHYEDVLVVRVLDLRPKAVWKKRYDHINAFERLLDDEGTRVVKVYLHISKDEQKRRLEARLADKEKQWKFDPGDLSMRAHWGEFMDAYEEAIERTSTDHAPWYIVPANRKWYRDLCVAEILVETLKDMDPKVPKPSFDPKAIKIPD